MTRFILGYFKERSPDDSLYYLFYTKISNGNYIRARTVFL